jgi:hypothetical protein
VRSDIRLNGAACRDPSADPRRDERKRGASVIDGRRPRPAPVRAPSGDASAEYRSPVNPSEVESSCSCHEGDHSPRVEEWIGSERALPSESVEDARGCAGIGDHTAAAPECGGVWGPAPRQAGPLQNAERHAVSERLSRSDRGSRRCKEQVAAREERPLRGAAPAGGCDARGTESGSWVGPGVALPDEASGQREDRGHVGTPLGRPLSPPLGRSVAPPRGRPPESSPPEGRSGPSPRRGARMSRVTAEPLPDVPRYIQECDRNPKRQTSMFVFTWRLDNSAETTRRPYVCNSWRCPYGCAVHQSHVLFARLQKAFDGLPTSEIVFLVLTLPGIEHDKRGESLAELYQGLSVGQRHLQKRWRRLLEKLGHEDFKNKWVSVVEAHASGVPHLNVLIHSPALAREAAKFAGYRMGAGATKRLGEHMLIGGDWLEHVTDVGFGERSTWDVVRNDQEAKQSRDRLFSYLVEVAKRVHTTHRELAKRTQLPLVAPKGFRRVRSGVGFLPKKRKNPDISGTIVRRMRTYEGDEIVMPLVRSKNEAYNLQVEAVCELEQRLAWDDEARHMERARLRRLGLPLKMADGERVTRHRIKVQPPPSRGPPEPPTPPPEWEPDEDEQSCLFAAE